MNVGFCFLNSPVSNQVKDIYLECLRLNKDIKNKFSLIVKLEDYKQTPDWFDINTLGCEVFLFGDAEKYKLNFFDVLIFSESNFSVYEDYPDSIVKIGLPHGVDIPILKTIEVCGAGYCFDYILSITRQPVYSPEYFFDRFPIELRHHSRPYLAEIPFGFPKLDRFIQRVDSLPKNKRQSIIYHLSYLSIEEDWVCDEVLPTLRMLLESFSNRKIVFRPYHLDREHELIKECVRLGRRYSNFFYSTDDSYINDYSSGLVMLCHRRYQQHLFGLATGGSTVLCTPYSDTDNSGGYEGLFTCSPNKLVDCINHALSEAENVTKADRDKRCFNAGIHHPGESIKYLLSKLDDIFQNNEQPDWNYYYLNPNPTHNLNREICLNLLSVKRANLFFVSLSGLSDDIRSFALLCCADSFARANFLHFYYYRYSLNFLSKMLVENDISDELNCLVNKWWFSSGLNVLGFLEEESRSNGVGLLESKNDLIKNFFNEKVPEIDHAFKGRFFNLSKLEVCEKIPPVIIYGAGKVAEDLFSSFALKVLAVVDSDINKKGYRLHGYSIESLEYIESMAAKNDVLICSYAFVEDIYKSLLKHSDHIGDIYAIVYDDVISSLLQYVSTLKKKGQF